MNGIRANALRKLAAISSGISYLFLAATSAFAQIKIDPPKVGNSNVGYTNISQFINNSITLVFIIAAIIVLFMLVWGAIEWIFSGGNKEAVTSARGRIIHALIGFTILAVAFAIIQLAGQFLGFSIIGTDFPIPGPTR